MDVIILYLARIGVPCRPQGRAVTLGHIESFFGFGTGCPSRFGVGSGPYPQGKVGMLPS